MLFVHFFPVIFFFVRLWKISWNNWSVICTITLGPMQGSWTHAFPLHLLTCPTPPGTRSLYWCTMWSREGDFLLVSDYQALGVLKAEHLTFAEQKAVLHFGYTHDELKIYSIVKSLFPLNLSHHLAYYYEDLSFSNRPRFRLQLRCTLWLKMSELDATFDHLVYLFDCVG